MSARLVVITLPDLALKEGGSTCKEREVRGLGKLETGSEAVKRNHHWRDLHY